MLTVLWDNDGVLVDSEGLYFQACREALGSIGVGLTLEQFKDISLRRGESVFLLATEQGIAGHDVDQLRTQRDQRYTELLALRCPAIDGAKEVVRALQGRARMGVVTSSRHRHFEAAHANSGLVPYMDFVLTREDYTHSKPNPEPYLTAMERHGLQPEHCIVVEDSERGLAAATAAGVNCIVVLSEWTKGGNFTAAVAVVENISGVAEEVLRRAGRP